MIQPENETNSTFTRTTIEGRILTYKLHVVQQPMRARACGSGPRSSSDRRPVDPPPVVQLRVFEGEHAEKDITMNYDATFVLYASLEVARPIANGRMYTGTVFPVLTGVPVAGTAYLDRPQQAGYFIFPDLSVRHEGWFNLRFCLFEGVKNAKDADPDRTFVAPEPPASGEPDQPRTHEAMANRMEVRSTKFQVFSAKKFPGLESSTGLSRCIAEQGCRVRIRRDVRQRKRAHKDETFDEDERSYRATPESSYHTPTPHDHVRSMSRNSYDGSQYGDQSYLRNASGPPAPFPPIHTPASPIGPVSRSIATPPPPMQQTAYTPALPPMAPPLSTGSSGFIMPPPRPSVDNATNPYHRPSFASTMNSTVPPPGPMTSEQSLQKPERSSVTLPPIQLENGQRLWNIPDYSGPQKRSLSRNATHDGALKSGARPDTQAPPTPATPHSADLVSPHGPHIFTAGAIEPDTGADEDDDSDDSLMDGVYEYKRADGSQGRKITGHYRAYGWN